jgi:hypothetical protein
MTSMGVLAVMRARPLFRSPSAKNEFNEGETYARITLES